ncbi:MADS-box transcription factor 8 isoform X1 [Panicum miliaceum]|uniref:MADS-box transcription factor 8 isoform X1 n=1 Tax=Panicum miliaceum TaxID=4540 RepID=A0A3L6QVA4_PANMI|nr:MADS-box transcription factor 8 isoform X1 [Panicum miliaceum]
MAVPEISPDLASGGSARGAAGSLEGFPSSLGAFFRGDLVLKYYMTVNRNLLRPRSVLFQDKESSITKTLERYQKSSYGGPDTAIQNKEDELVQSSRNEYLKLKARVENLQRTQRQVESVYSMSFFHDEVTFDLTAMRNLLGEDLGTLGIKELEQLEKQLDSSLRHIRSTRTQHMLDQLTDLQRRFISAQKRAWVLFQLMMSTIFQEHMLCEANKCLRRRLEETSSQVHGQQVWEHGANLLGYERQSPQQGPSHVSNGFFHPLEVAPEPTLQIGFAPEHMNNFMPTWLP